MASDLPAAGNQQTTIGLDCHGVARHGILRAQGENRQPRRTKGLIHRAVCGQSEHAAVEEIVVGDAVPAICHAQDAREQVVSGEVAGAVGISRADEDTGASEGSIDRTVCQQAQDDQPFVAYAGHDDASVGLEDHGTASARVPIRGDMNDAAYPEGRIGRPVDVEPEDREFGAGSLERPAHPDDPAVGVNGHIAHLGVGEGAWGEVRVDCPGLKGPPQEPRSADVAVVIVARTGRRIQESNRPRRRRCSRRRC